MGKVGKGRGRRCDCRDVDGSTRRDFLMITSVLGLDLAVGGPVLAEPSDERPKEGDVLVAIEGERQTPLEPKDIPAGGPPVLAWPMDLAANVVRSGSRLNKVLLLSSWWRSRSPRALASFQPEVAHGAHDLTGEILTSKLNEPDQNSGRQ